MRLNSGHVSNESSFIENCQHIFPNVVPLNICVTVLNFTHSVTEVVVYHGPHFHYLMTGNVSASLSMCASCVPSFENATLTCTELCSY